MYCVIFNLGGRLIKGKWTAIKQATKKAVKLVNSFGIN